MALCEVHYNDEALKLSYSLHNLEYEKSMLILHGWGSSRQIMEQAFTGHFGSLAHIYLDLPGFGKSTHPHIPLDSYEYAKIVSDFLKNIDMHPTFIMGHSFGGKIAALLAPKNLILLSSAGIVEPKSFKVRSKIALAKLLRPVLGGRVRAIFASKDATGLSPVVYGSFKKVVNEDFTEVFKNVHSKTAIFWGEEDKATSLQAAYMIDRLINNSILHILSGDHFFFLKHQDEIERRSKEYYNEL